ncbi:hypothetical protein MMC10_005891 [Thelotrema lepadinum]|nr:hypothetical protein [Thelotrema lepadinum]
MGPPYESKNAKLLVGKFYFETTQATLTQLDYFKAFFDKENMGAVPDENGVYFVDADGDQFGHILTYLLHCKFPLFWDKASGFEFEKYARLASQADFFGVDALKNWIKNENFKTVVEVRKRIVTIPMREAIDGQIKSIDAEFKILSTHWETKKQYVCPRGIAAHYGQFKNCGRACHNARGGEPLEYEDELVMVAAAEDEHIKFHFDRLTEGST